MLKRLWVWFKREARTRHREVLANPVKTPARPWREPPERPEERAAWARQVELIDEEYELRRRQQFGAVPPPWFWF